ncbi:MAG: 23S rRNA (guanosine(2251)-2'-O)-methyltransferase RlmB [Burkholderiales bacterium]|jgi:23S rRNA (guanosine2251-2'-O)-methyltransferase|nr:23S rRNA (guanosine(2251)-2'-O)-methyltransferase RlmB [Burkholderiales bacterium]
MNHKLLIGFHAVGVRIKVHPQTVLEIQIDSARRDQRMRQFAQRAQEAGIRILPSNDALLTKTCGTPRHQGVVARVQPLPVSHSLDDTLDAVSGEPLLLVLDGVTDPHNLGACLRVADGAGACAVIAPKDHAVGVNATVAKVASGAAETVPYFMVTNLARTLAELKEREIRIVGLADDAGESLYARDLRGPLAFVLGAEGSGLRQLTRKTCDALVHLPMLGAVDSLNVSVASGICLYEALRQRAGAQGE